MGPERGFDECKERTGDQAVVGTCIPDGGRSDSAGGNRRGCRHSWRPPTESEGPQDRFWAGMRGSAAPQASGRREQHLLERCNGEPRATTHSPARSWRERPSCATGRGPPPPSSTRSTARSDALRPRHAALHHHVLRTSARCQHQCSDAIGVCSGDPISLSGDLISLSGDPISLSGIRPASVRIRSASTGNRKARQNRAVASRSAESGPAGLPKVEAGVRQSGAVRGSSWSATGML